MQNDWKTKRQWAILRKQHLPETNVLGLIVRVCEKSLKVHQLPMQSAGVFVEIISTVVLFFIGPLALGPRPVPAV